MTEGYVVVAIGDVYLKMAEAFISTLRRHGDDREVHVIESTTDLPHRGLCNTDFERNGTLPKICLDIISPFDHNIYLDIDMLCVGKTDYVWDLCKSQEQYLYQAGIAGDRTFNRGEIAAYTEAQGWGTAPRVQGGFIYLNKTKLDPTLYEWMREDVFLNYHDYFSKPLRYKNSRTDQTIYSLAHAKYGLEVMPMLEKPVMTFLDRYETLPTNRVFFKGQQALLDKPVAFCHMMAKPGNPVYNQLYSEAMK
jgi:hypothetical protein